MLAYASAGSLIHRSGSGDSWSGWHQVHFGWNCESSALCRQTKARHSFNNTKWATSAGGLAQATWFCYQVDIGRYILHWWERNSWVGAILWANQNFNSSPLPLRYVCRICERPIFSSAKSRKWSSPWSNIHQRGWNISHHCRGNISHHCLLVSLTTSLASYGCLLCQLASNHQPGLSGSFSTQENLTAV
jgi:hypothetical protein